MRACSCPRVNHRHHGGPKAAIRIVRSAHLRLRARKSDLPCITAGTCASRKMPHVSGSARVMGPSAAWIYMPVWYR